MDLKDIEALIQLAKKEKILFFDYSKGDERVSFSFSPDLRTFHSPSLKTKCLQEDLEEIQPSLDPPLSSHSPQESLLLHPIFSPFGGTFSFKKSDHFPSPIKVGQKVIKGETLAFVEAMKVVNEIKSPVQGRIVEVCVKDQSFVDFGQVLFFLEKE